MLRPISPTKCGEIAPVMRVGVDEVRDHGAGVGLLNLGGEVTLGHPRRSAAEPVGQLHLLEEVGEHRSLVRQVAMHLGLADGEEDVEFHRTVD